MRADMHTQAVVALVVLLTLPAAVSGARDPAAAAFYSALRANDLATVSALLDKGASADASDDRGVTPLMNAAAVGSIEGMKLLIDRGATVNARNTLGSTALMWCVTDLAKVRLLLEHGADPNLSSTHGRTPLFLAAMSDQSAEIVRRIIAAGANVRAVDKTQMTVLHGATMGGDVETVRLLIAAGLDVNAADVAGFTPLINAAQRGNTAAVQMLLAKGANVNAVTDVGDVQTHTSVRVKNGPLGQAHFTALLLAVPGGPPALVTALLDAGADVNAQDIRGLTPLMLAIATDHGNIETVRILLARGADPRIKSVAGETALDWARKFGPTPTVALLERAGAPESGARVIELPTAAPAALRPAVQRGITLIERTTSSYFAKGGCQACHAQNITDVAAPIARAKGVQVDEAASAVRLKETSGRFISAGPMLLERIDTAGTPDIPLYTFLALASRAEPPSAMTDAMIANLVAQQHRDGRWHLGGLARPPIQDGDIFRTALAIRALAVYAPPGRAREMNERAARAKAWLVAAAPTTTADYSMKLLGLKWAGMPEEQLRPYAKPLLAAQRADGGWAQRAELQSDAHATGQALYALAMAVGAGARDAAYAKGIAYLLSTQRADGSWYVRSRAPGFQPYFESGFPYGPDQWISAMATGWATAALAAAIEPPRATSAPRQR